MPYNPAFLMSICFMLVCSLVTPDSCLAQEECELAVLSHYVIDNQTDDTLKLTIDHLHQKSFPTPGPEQMVIPPNTQREACNLEWAGEFKNPTSWYVFEWERKSRKLDLIEPSNWIFRKTIETDGVYTLTVEE